MPLAATLIACHALSLLATVFLSDLPFGASLLLRTASVLVTPLFRPRLLLWASFWTRFVALVFVLASVVVLTGLSPVFVSFFVLVLRFFVLRMIGTVGALLRKCWRRRQKEQEQQHSGDASENSHVNLR
jgi:hypothetical protein